MATADPPLERREAEAGFGLAALAQTVAAVAATQDLEAAADVATRRATDLLGAGAASVWVCEGDRGLRLVARRGPVIDESLDWLDLGASNPLSDAVRERTTVTAASPAEIQSRWPELFADDSSRQSVIVLPLQTPERVLGAIGLTFRREHVFTPNAVTVLEALADSFAQAALRFEANAAADQVAERMTFLAEASQVLAESLDYEATLRTVAELAVPRLADWCAIDLLEEGRLRRVAVSHVDPDKVALAWELWERYPPDLDAPNGTAAVLRTGQPELVDVIDEAFLDQLDLDDERRRMVADLELHSVLTVPLIAREHTLGVMSFTFAESRRRFGPDDVRFAEDLARRAAVAIDNSTLHSDAVHAALELQRAILPETYADSDRWRVAVHYRPAGRTEVGGDFFDALSRRDGRMVAAVGDVMGRGISAAATMAQVRAAMRGFITEDPEPASVLRRLDAMFVELDLPQLVTLLYAVLDLESGTAQIAHAGHIPPMVLHADGSVESVTLPVSPPLGLTSGDRHLTTVAFSAADTLILFSDGLVERRGEDIDAGLERLAASVGPLAGAISDLGLSRLADTLRQAGHDDDVTILAVQPLVAGTRPPAPELAPPPTNAGRYSPAELRLGGEADAVPKARHFARLALESDLEDLAVVAELVVSELVTNAVLHGAPPVVLRLNRLEDGLRVEVDDRGRDLPVRTVAESDGMTGRGLALVASVSRGWGVVPGRNQGKTVWAELPLDGSPTGAGEGSGDDLDRLLDAWPDLGDPDERPVHLGYLPTHLVLASEAHTKGVQRELALMRGQREQDPHLHRLIDELEQAAGAFSHPLHQLHRQAMAARARGESSTDVHLKMTAVHVEAAGRYARALEDLDRFARSARTLALAAPRSHRLFRQWLVDAVSGSYATDGATPPTAFAEVLSTEADTVDDLGQQAARLAVLQEMVHRLAGATTAQEMAEIAVDVVGRSVALRTARVYRLGADGVARSVAWHNDLRSPGALYHEFGIDDDLPGAAVLRSGEPIVLGSLAEIHRAFPDLVGYYPTDRSLHVVPLTVEGRRIGVMGLTFDPSETVEQGQLDFVAALAGILAQAMARVPLQPT